MSIAVDSVVDNDALDESDVIAARTTVDDETTDFCARVFRAYEREGRERAMALGERWNPPAQDPPMVWTPEDEAELEAWLERVVLVERIAKADEGDRAVACHAEEKHSASPRTPATFAPLPPPPVATPSPAPERFYPARGNPSGEGSAMPVVYFREDHKPIVARFNAGDAIDDIAHATGRSYKSIEGILSLARKLGLVTRARRAGPHPGEELTDLQQRVLAAASETTSPMEIAKLVGTTEGSAKSTLARLRLLGRVPMSPRQRTRPINDALTLAAPKRAPAEDPFLATLRRELDELDRRRARIVAAIAAAEAITFIEAP